MTYESKAAAARIGAGLACRKLAIDVCADAFAGGLAFDFICGDEVCGSCTDLRGLLRLGRPGRRRVRREHRGAD